jgi:hypothetical protein
MEIEKVSTCAAIVNFLIHQLSNARKGEKFSGYRTPTSAALFLVFCSRFLYNVQIFFHLI